MDKSSSSSHSSNACSSRSSSSSSSSATSSRSSSRARFKRTSKNTSRHSMHHAPSKQIEVRAESKRTYADPGSAKMKHHKRSRNSNESASNASSSSSSPSLHVATKKRGRPHEDEHGAVSITNKEPHIDTSKHIALPESEARTGKERRSDQAELSYRNKDNGKYRERYEGERRGCNHDERRTSTGERNSEISYYKDKGVRRPSHAHYNRGEHYSSRDYRSRRVNGENSPHSGRNGTPDKYNYSDGSRHFTHEIREEPKSSRREELQGHRQSNGSNRRRLGSDSITMHKQRHDSRVSDRFENREGESGQKADDISAADSSIEVKHSVENATVDLSKENAKKLTTKLDSNRTNTDDKAQVEKAAGNATEGTDSKLTAANALGRTGGIYIPPFKLARLQNQISDKTSSAYQRQTWDALRKSINGLVNKVNTNNIVNLVQELFRENLIRARGLVARAIIRAQMASPGFTHIYAALLAIINSKFPEIGEVVTHRVILQFRRAYRRNDKIVCFACVKFIAHLVNQRVAHELIALQLAALLLEKATDDSIEVAVAFIQEVGQMLNEVSKRGFDAIFERLRAILQEGDSERKTQYTIEKLWDLRRTNFKDYPALLPELDLVDEDDQITHEVDLLDETIKGEEMLNVFKAKSPEEYEEDERKWLRISKEVLGEEVPDSDKSSSSEDSEEGEDEDLAEEEDANKDGMRITDYTEQDSINLRKAIYLTIMSSVNFEECVHKLLKLNIKDGQEKEVCTMLIDCCAMERAFQRYYALQAERLAKLKSVYADCLSDCFKRQYATVHRLETNNLRNTAKFFALLLYTDAITWEVLDTFVLTEGGTTSSGRIFIKILFQELSENLGLSKLNERLHDPSLAPHLKGIFPSDNPRNVRFAINFFTAIGLGGLTDDLRDALAEAQQRNIQQSRSRSTGSSSTSSSSGTSSSSSSSSED